MFVTALYGALDTVTGEFVYARAGHEPPLLVRGDDGGTSRYHLEGEGRLLGLFDEVSVNNATLSLGPDDSLVLYTDGVVEARNREREFFGETRLSELASQSLDLPAQALCDRIIAEVAAHSGEPAQADDITVVSIRRA